MEAKLAIKAFLGAVRKSLERSAWSRAAFYTAGALAALALVAPLLAYIAQAGHGTTIGKVSLVASVSLIFFGIYEGVVYPRRRWQGDRDVARFVGRQNRAISSDLLSSVELSSAHPPGSASTAGSVAAGEPGTSTREDRPQNPGSDALVEALIEQTAQRVHSLSPSRLVPRKPVQRARTVFLVAALFSCAAYVFAPTVLASGWHRMITARTDGPFGGAALSDRPLVGDITITLEYPLYTGRPVATLPSGSGDLRIMPGTTVSIETTALAAVDSAQLIFGQADAATSEDSGEQNDSKSTDAAPSAATDRRAETSDATSSTLDPIDMTVQDTTLRATFTLTEPTVYRFLLSRAGDRRTEKAGHHIEVEADTAPSVELYAPADELDVTSLKRIELAYIAEDDYGIAKVELVIHPDDGSDGGKQREPAKKTANASTAGAKKDRPGVQRKLLPLSEPGRRRAQNKYILDLAEVTLEPGVRVAYHVEVTDNDAVLGPNVGKSKIYYLRVFSPRERHEALVDRQQELFEKLLHQLGERLIVDAEDLRAHHQLSRDLGEAVIEAGGLLAALGEDALASKELISALTEIRARIDKARKAETKLLARMDRRQAQGGGGKQIAARMAASDKTFVAELEDDVLLLADWLDRQRLEIILAVTDEIKSHQDRLRDLFKELERTGSPEIQKEIERELNALEKKLAQLAQKQGALAADVVDQFMNEDAPAPEQMASCTEEVRALMAAGDVTGAKKKMEECALELANAAQALEGSLSALRGDKFGEEEKKLGELMNDLADLTADQQEIAEKADDLWDRYAERADEMMRDTAKETRKKLSKTIEKLNKQLSKIPGSGLTPFAKEELEVAKSRIKDMQEMLADGDMAEALAMAKQAKSGLDTIDAELESALEDEPRGPFARRTRDARKAVRKTQPLARKLAEELEAATPSPRDIMSKKDKRRMDKLRRQQRSVRDRARRLSKKVQQDATKLPGRVGSEVPKALKEATEPMSRAQQNMRGRDPSAARQAAREASDKLERLRRDAQGAARQQQPMGGRGMRNETVRIPGSDEYKAPEKFREEILEAMKKEGAPQGFSELVKRYYEELIR